MQIIQIIVTVVIEDGITSKDNLLQEVIMEMEGLETRLMINISVAEVDRFGYTDLKANFVVIHSVMFLLFSDGCLASETVIPSSNNDESLSIIIEWPETNIGETAIVSCPCGNMSSGDGLMATRYCGGNFEEGAVWEENPNVTACNFSQYARQVCKLSEVSFCTSHIKFWFRGIIYL